MTYIGKIFSDSPYYIDEIGSAGFTSQIKVWIWSGDKNSKPTSPSYTLQKQALSSSDTVVTFEVSKLINEFFQHIPDVYDSGHTSSSNMDSLWVSITSQNGTTDRDDLYLGFDAYSVPLDGINFNYQGYKLFDEPFLYYVEDEPIRFPLFVDDNTGVRYVYTYDADGLVSTTDLSTYFDSVYSYDKVQYLSFPTDTNDITYIELADNVDTLLETIPVTKLQCSKYPKIRMSYTNQYGVLADFWFSGNHKASTTFERNTYKKQLVSYSAGSTYNTYSHKHSNFNTTGRENITLNTGYIDGGYNHIIQEILVSDHVWLTLGGEIYPVNIENESIEFIKSHDNNLINYTIRCSYSFNLKNDLY